MKIKVQRYCKHREPNAVMAQYDVPLEECTLLEALYFIKEKIDPTLTFNSGCRSEVCGSCAVRVNGREQLACAYKVHEEDIVEPLSKLPVLKDLVVDHEISQANLKQVKSWINSPAKPEILTIEDEKRIEKQTDCILCSSCFSACPVLEVDQAFLGPFALTRAYRYTSDKRCENEKERIDAVQQKGIWDCTLCGECTAVCPQGIDPKNDILMLRSKSTQYGYSDPAFAAGGDDMFGGGFDPGF
jgi:fumarate reductase iron-sulfur subunit